MLLSNLPPIFAPLVFFVSPDQTLGIPPLSYLLVIDANMAELLAIITGFMVAELLSWTEFTIASDSKVAVECLTVSAPIKDIYSSLCTFCRDLPSWNRKKEVRHVQMQEVHIADCLSHQARTEIPQKLRLFRLPASPSCVDDVIIFDFRHLVFSYDVTFEFLLSPVTSSPLPVFEGENETSCCSFDVP
jgi:reverse transcriptase-like protein